MSEGDSQNTKEKVIDSLFWKLMERGGVQGIQFIVQIILARILSPDDYGIISLISIFISLANIFIQSGFNTALIQKKNLKEEDFSSVLYISLVVSTLLYIILFFSSPIIADFYKIEELKNVIRVLCIILFFGAFNSIQNAIIARTMQFKKLFNVSIFSILISGMVGITLAYSGFGVWALVAQQITNQVSITFILWLTLKWRPKLTFSINRVGDLFSYGWKLLVASLIDALYLNVIGLVVGKLYTSQMLAFYSKGEQFPQLIVNNINGSIQSVMLPTLSAEQENRKRVKELVRRTLIVSSFIIFPLMIGLAVVAEPLIIILLTDKWLPCVPFMQIFCLTYALRPIHTANLQAINALGRSDIFLKLEIIKKIIGFAILSISIFYGIYAIILGSLLLGIISSFIDSYPNSKLLDYSYKEQMKDIIPSLILSLIMGLVVYGFLFLNLSLYLTLVIQVLTGAILYISLAKLLKLECYEYLLSTIKDILIKR